MPSAAELAATATPRQLIPTHAKGIKVNASCAQMRSGISYVVSGLAVAGLFACRDLPEEPQRSLDARGALANRVVRRIQTIDDDFAGLADQIEGFGGMFYDSNGRLNI